MPEKQSEKRPIGLISIDTKTVYDRLIKAKVGEVVGYVEITALIGRDVANGARWVLQSACRKAQHENAFVFEAIRKVGVKRLADTDTVDSIQGIVSRIHRQALKGTRRIGTVEYANLPNDAKTKYNTYASLTGVIGHVTRAKEIKKLTDRVETAQAQLPLAKTLEAFK